MSVEEASAYVRGVRLRGRDELIARDIIPEIRERLKFLEEVGLGYLHLGRSVTTLSGGEAQRIRLAAQLGSNLSGVLYILDEPTIGLHSRDNEHLLHALNLLKSRGNSLIVVEHDEDTMRQADYIIDLGPGAGVHGGSVVAQGTLNELLRNEDSITGQALNAPKNFPARGQRRSSSIRPAPRGTEKRGNEVLTLEHASSHNLKNLTVHFPLRRFVVVTGVSGSGKSTLLRECLIPALKEVIGEKRPKSAVLEGFESIKALYEVDQAPIGRTPRSIPATYIGFFDQIRELYAQSPDSRLRGYTAARFSFNSAQGRCPACEGAGRLKLEMNFLPPAYVTCDHCRGTRYNPETLDIQFRGKSIAEVLDLSVSEAIDFFQAITKIRRPLEALRDTGLDYLKLGQISPTLSGGEAQRIKLVSHLLSGLKEQGELFNPLQKHNLFILEEPTIGLHMTDVARLVAVLQRLVDAGHSVIVIEHNLDLIAEADWVIDLGPEAGEAGGEVVCEGTPEQVAKNKRSHTARFLRKLLQS
jgi:excinuclease ABC subunit A